MDQLYFSVLLIVSHRLSILSDEHCSLAGMQSDQLGLISDHWSDIRPNSKKVWFWSDFPTFLKIGLISSRFQTKGQRLKSFLIFIAFLSVNFSEKSKKILKRRLRRRFPALRAGNLAIEPPLRPKSCNRTPPWGISRKVDPPRKVVLCCP